MSRLANLAEAAEAAADHVRDERAAADAHLDRIEAALGDIHSGGGAAAPADPPPADPPPPSGDPAEALRAAQD